MAKQNIVTTDPIADMLTRIRNAGSARHEEVNIPFSKMKMDIAQILVEEGFIKSAEKQKTDEGFMVIHVVLKAGTGANRVIQGLRRISKPGLRVYSPAADLPRVLNGLGVAVISTSKGVMTDKHAREKNLGGEVLAYVW